ncbi:hypothetical protein MTR67_013739 [Solanum verrucosum]|uniref:Uncharacterized protein n=1 Tax=Solanum verrucosum TaxID=315347 RepID=A0AAF0QAZ5_SOLVR|nr:hypothetical protein MTR67_013739 [Solanum verrucosum]
MTNCNIEAKKGNITKKEGPQTNEGKTGQIIVQNHKETTQGHNKEINRNKANTAQNLQYMDKEGFTKVTRNKNKTKTVSSTNNTGNSNVDKGKRKMGEESKVPLNGGSSMNTEDEIVEEGGSKQPEVENDQDQPEKIKSVQALRGNIEKVPVHPKKIKSKHVDNTSSDEDVAESFLETVEEDDEEVADNLIDAFALFPKESDPMIQEQEELMALEHEISRLEDLYDVDDSYHNREALHRTQTKYIKWLKRQDSILRQKARLKWIAERDTNSKYFYSVIRDRKRRSRIHKIKDRHGTWVEGKKRINYFTEIAKKIMNKIVGWQGRFLSPGGKVVLIQHVLQSQPLHIFAALKPHVTVIKETGIHFSNFF